jgi:hypothetical protein
MLLTIIRLSLAAVNDGYKDEYLIDELNEILEQKNKSSGLNTSHLHHIVS